MSPATNLLAANSMQNEFCLSIWSAKGGPKFWIRRLFEAGLFDNVEINFWWKVIHIAYNRDCLLYFSQIFRLKFVERVYFKTFMIKGKICIDFTLFSHLRIFCCCSHIIIIFFLHKILSQSHLLVIKTLQNPIAFSLIVCFFFFFLNISSLCIFIGILIILTLISTTYMLCWKHCKGVLMGNFIFRRQSPFTGCVLIHLSRWKQFRNCLLRSLPFTILRYKEN